MAIHYSKGTHKAVICGQEFIETDYGVQLAIKILPENGEYERTVFLGLTDEKGRPAKYESDTETVNIYDRSLEIIAYLGLPDGRLSRLDPGHPEHISFNGRGIEAYCQHKTKEDGSEVERWYINTPRALPGKPVDGKGLKKLDSLFGRALKDKQKAASQPEPATPPVDLDAETELAVAEAGDDPVPF